MKPVLRDEQHLHYVTLRTIQLRQPWNIYLKVHSWGRTYQGLLNKIDFLERFFGYISAKP